MLRFALASDADNDALAGVLDGIESAAREGGLRAGTVDRVVLVAGELLSNALEHGTAPVTGLWEATPAGGRLVLSGRGGPVAGWIRTAALPDADSTSGRGLFIVRELSDGAEDSGGDFAVSFEARPSD